MKNEFCIRYNKQKENGLMLLLVVCIELRGEAGFNIYMCIKHEHSIIILLSYLL